MSGTAAEGPGNSERRSVRSLLLPLDGVTLLVPHTVVAEIGEHYRGLVVEPSAPPWVLGLIAWRGVEIPVVALERLVQGGREPGGRLAVFNALSPDSAFPFFGVALRALPRRLVADAEAVSPGGSEPLGGLPVCCSVAVQGQAAVIPDLDTIETMLAMALNETPLSL